MTTIYMTRHGQTKWNLEGRSQGSLDSDLTELGMKQALQLGLRLKDVAFDVVYTSTAGRTIATAEHILQGKKTPQVRDHRFGEMDFGDWQGRLWDEVRTFEPERFKAFWDTPDLFHATTGESYPQFMLRVKQAFDDLMDRHKGQQILLVVHGGVLKALFSIVEEIPLREFWTQKPYMSATNLSVLEVTDHAMRFVLKGDVTHLEDESLLSFT